MSFTAVALLGALAWIGLRGQADPVTFGVGLLISSIAAWRGGLPLRWGASPGRLARRLFLVGRILVRFGFDLAVANARQLRLILSPRLSVRPRWIRFATTLEHPASRIVLGVMISLTPGTVTQELRGDEFVIHVLDAEPDEDPAAVIRERFETLLEELEAL